MKESRTDAVIASGCHSLDGEHSVQIELLTAFSRAVKDGRPRGEVDEILDRLIDFTKVHFSSEQLLMRLYQYPAYQQHSDDHHDTVDCLQTMRQAYLAGEHDLTCSTADALAERLIEHIRSADRGLGSFLLGLGVR
jgi:hemerythrin